MTYTIEIHKFQPTDPRLGRHVHHDSRNRLYAYDPAWESDASESGFSANATDIDWTSVLPVSDQGNVGACTGFTVLDILGYSKYWDGLTDAERAYIQGNLNATGDLFYHTATVLDSIPGQWQPDDTGSDCASAAKGGKKLGYLAGYHTAFGPQAFIAALTNGPVMVGTRWDNSMMNPDSQGVIVPDLSSGVAGGHAYLIDGYSARLDAYRMRNHWSQNWGLAGFAWIPRLPFLGLLADQGDATVPVPLNAPAPVPTPPPAPTPAPAPVPDADLVEAWSAFHRYATKQGWK